MNSGADSTNTDDQANVIGFDYGTKRIGVAVGHQSLGSARGLGIVRVIDGTPDSQQVRNLVDEWQPGQFVVGIPVRSDGSTGPLNREIDRFGEWLNRTFDLPVSYVDERLSSEEASHRMKSRRTSSTAREKSELRNQIAAQIILETYFAS